MPSTMLHRDEQDRLPLLPMMNRQIDTPSYKDHTNENLNNEE